MPHICLKAIPALLAIAAAAISTSQAAPTASERLPFNQDWRFIKESDPGNSAWKLDYTSIKDWLKPAAASFCGRPTQEPAGEKPGEAADVTFTNLANKEGLPASPFRTDVP
jgi:hypothetical protein